MKPLILASSSVFRKNLLKRLQLPFETYSPEVDETALPGEQASTLAQRLSIAKAKAVLSMWGKAVVIGSDQVAELDGQIIGKPGNRENAIQQLQQASGRTVRFYTGLSVQSQSDQHLHLDTTEVRFRTLSEAEIMHYVDHEQVIHCAGSFKSEGLGISLFSAIKNEDPSALIGLPLIALCQILRKHGLINHAE